MEAQHNSHHTLLPAEMLRCSASLVTVDLAVPTVLGFGLMAVNAAERLQDQGWK